MSCSWRPGVVCRLAVAALALSFLGVGSTLATQAATPGQARLKGQIGDLSLGLGGRCHLARKGEPFTFWSDGDEAPALGDADRDGWYLFVAVSRSGPTAPAEASIVFRHRGTVVLDDARVPGPVLSGNTLTIDTQAVPAGGGAPIVLRLVIVCDTSWAAGRHSAGSGTAAR